MIFTFGDIVIVEETQVGVVVKSWENCNNGEITHEVYVRDYNSICVYKESEMKKFEYDKQITIG